MTRNHDDTNPLRRHATRAALGLSAMALILAAIFAPQAATADGSSAKVILNGTPVPVYFNDGDTFRVLKGRMKGARARLTGFNTLESYGPVHQWGTWTVKEMYVLAKMAMLHARRGVWTCETDGKTDTYGRLLAWCPDLAESMVRAGLAHAMTIDDNPAKPELIAAQREAIDARRGMWAHGVPPFVLTSLHSVEEDTTGKGTYNRLVSVEDGHSVMWKHQDRYGECARVCHMRYAVNDDRIPGVVAALKAEKAVATLIEGISDDDLAGVVRDFAALRHVNRSVAKDNRQALAAHLTMLSEAGMFGEQVASEAGCMVHIPYQRRFGGGKAACLK